MNHYNYFCYDIDFFLPMIQNSLGLVYDHVKKSLYIRASTGVDLTLLYTNNKGTDQHVQLRSLISAFYSLYGNYNS